MLYKKVLLIDDDTDDQQIFQSALCGLSGDIEFEGLTNAEIALKKLAESSLNPDIIFLDLNMPKMNGAEFLQELSTRNLIPEIPVIIFSTSDDFTAVRKMGNPRVKNYITKPVDYKRLMDMLNTILN